MSPKPLTSAQIRAARALLRWSAEDLARASALGVTTIRRAELTEGQTSMTTANDLAVRRVLEAAGVAFIDGNGDGPGVRRAPDNAKRDNRDRSPRRPRWLPFSSALNRSYAGSQLLQACRPRLEYRSRSEAPSAHARYASKSEMPRIACA